MALFAASVWNCIFRDKVKLRGSRRTKRLRKKRCKHFDELYIQYRDETFVHKYGLPFLEWKALGDQEKRDLSSKWFLSRYPQTFPS